VIVYTGRTTGGMVSLLCWECFYKDRINPTISCFHSTRDQVQTKWNHLEERHETTELSIRPFPESFPPHVKYVAMCDPYRGTCRKHQCTFAHGQAEKKAWNGILRARSGN
jgi:hypothetical protein